MTSFIQLMIDAGWQVKAAVVQNGWLEVDTVDDIELYKHLHNEGRLNTFCKLD